jgi:hypothetical protein
MPKRLPKTVPAMLPGKVHEQRARCGKPNCRCAVGEPHRAFYRFWTEDGRQRKAYVRRGYLEATRESCERWAQAEAAKVVLRNSPGAAEVRALTRATLRAALCSQVDTPSARRQLRRLR